MQVVKLTCGGCGGPLEVQEGIRFASCTFCGAQLEIHETETARWSQVREELRDHSKELERLRLKQELFECEQRWTENRAKYLIHGAEPDSLPHDTTAKLGLIAAAIVSILATGFLISTYSTEIPNQREINEYEAREKERPLSLNRNTAQGIADDMFRSLKSPGVQRSQILRERGFARTLWFVHLAVYLIPAFAYANYLYTNDQAERLTSIRSSYQSRRSQLLADLASLDDEPSDPQMAAPNRLLREDGI